MAPNPAESLGPYQLVRCIGAGGMGQVWLARLKDWPEPVVVKRLHSALAADTRLVDRFLDEMLVMRRLRHRNVVRLLDGGHIGTTYYLVM
ncbi:MAG: protein kinase, partial [Deltaproteobacteria bacterium]|nr:protein kinase [Deltaproteobacteria bacterium]